MFRVGAFTLNPIEPIRDANSSVKKLKYLNRASSPILN